MRLPYAFVALAALTSIGRAQTFSAAPALDARINQAIRDGLIPGAVLLIGHDGKIVYRAAYGRRALTPVREAMTFDTIFDLASLTKVVATTPAIMKLYEQGKLRPEDPVTAYLPEFQGGTSDITIRDLMTHYSGLRPDLDLQPEWSGYETGIAKALMEKSTAPAGQRFVYSDINFELLGEIVRQVSGKHLDEFAREQIFFPLGMRDTMFRPPASLRARIAPTELDPVTGKPWRGIVHDPTARNMHGVAGHAGVFSTAADLAKYAQMWLDMGRPIFSPTTVAKFTSPASPPGQPVRSLGWDIDSPYSSPRGDFPVGSYGHTGFTGTSLWIDPVSRTYVILLTNAVHPHSGKNLSALRRSVGTIAAQAFQTREKASETTLSGLDVLEEEDFAPLRGQRVGLITNQTGLDRSARRNIDAMLQAGIQVTALYSPEHGLNGKLDQPNVADSKDDATGLPVWSLYQNSRFRMTPQMLHGVDLLVFDMQDAGARFYTYGCTMLAAMERAAAAKLPFYILDRPNPVTGLHIEGPMLDKDLESGIGCYNLPIRHGLTFGELATLANTEKNIGADLHVIAMKNWSRGQWFNTTGLAWVNPSPNLRSVKAAALYPGVAMLESAPNLSVGRGTETPFEEIGADWIRGEELAQFLNARHISGIRVAATHFKPADSVFKGKTIDGVRFELVDRESFRAARLGLELAYALNRLYPGKLDVERCKLSIGNRKTIDAMKAGREPSAVEKAWADDLAKYTARRKPYLLY